MKNKIIIVCLPLMLAVIGGINAQNDSVPSKELIKLRYFSENNSVQYILIEDLLKKGKVVEPVTGKTYQLFLDNNSPTNFIGKVTTDKNGKAKCFLPPSLKDLWTNTSKHNFLAIAQGNEEETAAELEISKSKIKIDTSTVEGKRNIIVTVTKYDNDAWVPANEVEMKIGIQRLGGILSAGDAETYTTDSTGTITVEVNKDSLPGDQQGNILLAAKVDDNDELGNLLVRLPVKWGKAVKSNEHFFDQRTLWSTRFKTPYWLLFMAYSIVIAVWSTIIYLVVQIVRIKKMGAPYPEN